MKESRKRRRSRRDSSSSSSSSSRDNSSSSSNTSDSSSSSSSSNSSTARKRRKKELKKKLAKQQKKEEKAKKKALRKEKKAKRKQEKLAKKLAKRKLKEQRKKEKEHPKDEAIRNGGPAPAALEQGTGDAPELLDCGIPLNLMNRKAMAPQTREEYEARQSILRRVVDPETGRTRLIKGDGEIIEECVTRDRHKEINRQATAGDGAEFQRKTLGRNVR
uniref:ADP-ribosylation factor-like protein 6-interacting protein 4 n=1 Tax=Anopheles maculatus TaxID=74869 RepID=A0A182SX50_9DIPT